MALVKCFECSNDVSDKAATCPKCGAPVIPMTKLDDPQSNAMRARSYAAAPIVPSPKSSVSTTEIHLSAIDQQRAAVAQAAANRGVSGIFWLQILLVSIAAGAEKESWLVFGGAFLALSILFLIPVVGKIVALLIACGFAYFGYGLGNNAWGQEAGYVIGGLLFMISIGASIGGVQHMKDLGSQ